MTNDLELVKKLIGNPRTRITDERAANLVSEIEHLRQQLAQAERQAISDFVLSVASVEVSQFAQQLLERSSAYCSHKFGRGI